MGVQILNFNILGVFQRDEYFFFFWGGGGGEVNGMGYDGV